MAASQAAVQVFLKTLRGMDVNKFRMSNQSKTIKFLSSIDWGKAEVLETLMRLTPDDYHRGPLTNDWGGNSSVWIFGSEITVNLTDKYRIYIKLSLTKSKQENWFANMSFHPTEESMVFPLAKPYKQWEVVKHA
ncbi:hypothetical protein [Pseudoduganella violaceinigra]|uniref:hypothetical protein n=1 Tax=Pseudoduganella violaceinigra TaxID=246602 RepID=UPI00048328D8|nr:hypothetical protein [Pseudoduganella violaceinigra]